MAELKNTTKGKVAVRGKILAPGESATVDEPSKAERKMFGLDKEEAKAAAKPAADDKPTGDAPAQAAAKPAAKPADDKK